MESLWKAATYNTRGDTQSGPFSSSLSTTVREPTFLCIMPELWVSTYLEALLQSGGDFQRMGEAHQPPS